MTSSPPPPQSTSETRAEQAHALCLRLLTVRPRTRSELAGQMAKRGGYPDDIAANELNRLAAVGLIDDADFAEQWGGSVQAGASRKKR